MSFIKLDRALNGWRYKDKPEYVALLVHLLLNANYEDKKWHDEEVKKGELITSLEHLSIDTGISIKKIRNILEKLKNEEIHIKRANKYTKISLIKWEEYQGDDSKWANKGQTKGKQRATTKEYIRNIRNKEDYTITLPYEL